MRANTTTCDGSTWLGLTVLARASSGGNADGTEDACFETQPRADPKRK